MNKNYDELDMMHENAKLMSGGNRWAYLALMILELVMSCGLYIIEKCKRFFKSLVR